MAFALASNKLATKRPLTILMEEVGHEVLVDRLTVRHQVVDTKC